MVYDDGDQKMHVLAEEEDMVWIESEEIALDAPRPGDEYFLPANLYPHEKATRRGRLHTCMAEAGSSTGSPRS